MSLTKTSAIFLIALSLSGFSCGQKITEKITEKAIESAVEKQSGGDMNVDLSKGQVTYKDKDGNQVQYGENITVPSDFPKEIPIYQDASIVALSNSKDSSSITMQTSAALATVTTWYEQQLTDAGWSKEGTFDFQGMSARTFMQGSKKMVVTVSSQDEQTAISIQLQSE